MDAANGLAFIRVFLESQNPCGDVFHDFIHLHVNDFAVSGLKRHAASAGVDDLVQLAVCMFVKLPRGKSGSYFKSPLSDGRFERVWKPL